MSEPFCNDGCDLSQRELLNMARIGLREGPRATAAEFASVLETLPAQIAGQPTEQKNRSLKALQEAGLPRLDYRELFKIEGEPLSEEDVKAMSEYFAQFLKPAPDTGCVRCGKRQSGGSNIIDQDFPDSGRAQTIDCPKCGKQPALDVSDYGEYFPSYQFVCWLCDIYGRDSQVIEYATESWNRVATSAKSPQLAPTE